MSFHQQKQYDSESGFTLIEVAVVMLIVSFMASGLIIGVPQYMHNKKTELTQQKMDLVSNALSAYAQRHYRLPCPAVTDNVANRGQERNNGNCFANNADETTLYVNSQGALPWRELGLSEQDVIDGWGRYITYKPAPHLTVNTYLREMQEDSAAPDGLAQTPDVHNACRNQTWYNAGRNHLNRQKALFCCNSHPKLDYLTGSGAAETNLTNLPAWRDNAITVAGVDNNNDTSDDNVVSTNAWIDDYTDVGAADGNLYSAGAFEDVFDEDADAPLIRASGHAVTLISHGGNGAFSFMRNQAETNRLGATMNADGSPNAVNVQESATTDERKNVWPPQIFAATLGHSKTNAHDKSGMRNGMSDDVVRFMRSDQLFAKAGSGATCVRPTGGDYTCPAFSYSNYVYVLDTSKSMNEVGLGDTRYNVSLTTLKDTNDPDDPINRIDSLLSQHITSEGKNDDDPDLIGMTGLAFKTRNELEVITGADVIEREYKQIRSDNYVKVGESCSDKNKCVSWKKISGCGPADEGCKPKYQCTKYEVKKVCSSQKAWTSSAAKDAYNAKVTEYWDLLESSAIKVSSNEWLTPLSESEVFLNYDVDNASELSLEDTANQETTITKAGDKLTPLKYDEHSNVVHEDSDGNLIYQTVDIDGNPLLDGDGNPTYEYEDGSFVASSEIDGTAENNSYLKADDNQTALYHTLIESAKLLGEEITITDPYDPANTKTIVQYGNIDEPASLMFISDGEDSITKFFGDKSKMVNSFDTIAGYQHLMAEPLADDPSYAQVTEGREAAIQKYYGELFIQGEITQDKFNDVITKLATDGYNHNLYGEFVNDMRINGNISNEAFFGYIMSANYPFLRINIIDVACRTPDAQGDGCNRSLEDIASLTNGAYLPTIDPNALEAYLRRLSSCLGDA